MKDVRKPVFSTIIFNMKTFISLSLLTIAILMITFYFFYKTLKEGNKALDEMKKNNK